MGKRAAAFLNSFNRIEKWLREQLDNPTGIGFSEMVRRVGRKQNHLVNDYQEDLLQMAQLRNAIVHEHIADDFVIAEPNEWAVERIQLIEAELTRPEQVTPCFEKNVTSFEIDIEIAHILAIIHKKRYYQFPIYSEGVFQGLITIRTIGEWLAAESKNHPDGLIQLKGRKAQELLHQDFKKINYQFVNSQTYVFEVEEMFREHLTLEAVLITKNGDPNDKLLGIIRPRDIYKKMKE